MRRLYGLYCRLSDEWVGDERNCSKPETLKTDNKTEFQFTVKSLKIIWTLIRWRSNQWAFERCLNQATLEPAIYAPDIFRLKHSPAYNRKFRWCSPPQITDKYARAHYTRHGIHIVYYEQAGIQRWTLYAG